MVVDSSLQCSSVGKSLGWLAASKYACTAGAPPLPAKCSPPESLFTLLQGRTAWFIGDSVSFGTFFEAVCRVERESGCVAHWKKVSSREHYSFTDLRMNRFPMCAIVGNGTIPHLIDHRRYSPTHDQLMRFGEQKQPSLDPMATLCYLPERLHVAAVLEARIEHGDVRPLDVVLLNAGSHGPSSSLPAAAYHQLPTHR